MAGKNDKTDKIKSLLETAEKGIKDVFTSDNYKKYLSKMSKFHNYSFRNSILIGLQKPDATFVAGYVAWQKNVIRYVKKGEQGIRIIGYTPKTITVQQEKKDEHGKIIMANDGNPVIETIKRTIPAFTPVSVFDISQTDGEPLPKLVNELSGTVQEYQNMMESLREISPFPIFFDDIEGGANGYCSPVEKKIVIKKGMSEQQTIKTTIHEITHADLHAPEINLTIDERTDRNTREIEAESTAFVVCEHFGIDSSDYTFPYLASWSSSRDLTELQNSLDVIQKQSSTLIDKLDSHLLELRNKKEPEKNISMTDKIENAKKQAIQHNNSHTSQQPHPKKTEREI